jgi:hypothetical protein
VDRHGGSEHNAAMDRRLAFALSVLAFAAPARAEIYRCTATGGAISYQETPCAAAQNMRVMDVPASYPPADSAGHARILAQAAEVDRRLEARRERESRESIAAMQVRAVAETVQPAPAVEPVYVYAWPRHAVRAGTRLRARSTHAM